MNKQEWREFVENTDPPFEVCDWGSCQYSSAQWYYDTFLQMRKDLSLEDTFDALGAKVTFEKCSPLRALQIAKNEITEELDEFYDQWNDPEDQEDHKELKERTEKATSIDELFGVLCDHSWDLWGAAPFLASCCFDDLKIEAPDSPGYGPVFNVMAQSENYEVGLCCALLKEFGFVESDECFGGFCT